MTKKINPKKRKYLRRKDGSTPGRKRKSYDRDQLENLLGLYTFVLAAFIWAVFISPNDPKAHNALFTTSILAIVAPYLMNVKTEDMIRSVRLLVTQRSETLLRDVNHTLLVTMSIFSVLSIMFIVDMSFTSKIGYSIGGVAGTSIVRAFYLRFKMR